MRYSRFKSQMEGTVPTTRKPKASGPRKRKENADEEANSDNKSKKTRKEKKSGESQDEAAKSEATRSMNDTKSSAPSAEGEPTEQASPPGPSIKPEPMIKQEPGINSTVSAPIKEEISTTEGSFVGHSPDSVPDSFSSAEDLQASAMIDPVLLAMDAAKAGTKALVAINGKEEESKDVIMDGLRL